MKGHGILPDSETRDTLESSAVNWGVYMSKDIDKTEASELLRIAILVERGELPHSALAEHGITLETVLSGDEAKAHLIREMNLDEDNEKVRAHEHSRDNRAEIARSARCGCFHCLEIFPAVTITNWVGDTARCPHCNMDAVLGAASGLEISDAFLQQMRAYWFDS